MKRMVSTRVVEILQSDLSEEVSVFSRVDVCGEVSIQQVLGVSDAALEECLES